MQYVVLSDSTLYFYVKKSKVSTNKVKQQDSFIHYKNLCIINRAQVRRNILGQWGFVPKYFFPYVC